MPKDEKVKKNLGKRRGFWFIFVLFLEERCCKAFLGPSSAYINQNSRRFICLSFLE